MRLKKSRRAAQDMSASIEPAGCKCARGTSAYLERLPGAMQGKELPSGEKVEECVYSPHSLRATTATLLLDSSVPIESVQYLLDHKHITTTQISAPLRPPPEQTDAQKESNRCAQNVTAAGKTVFLLLCGALALLSLPQPV
jgi:hypothetical protein